MLGFSEYYSDGEVRFGSADILCLGSQGVVDRTRLLIDALWRRNGATFPVSGFLVIFSPIHSGEIGSVAEYSLLPRSESPENKTRPIAVQTLQCRDLRTETLLSHLKKTPSRNIVIVIGAADYRSVD